MEDLNEKQKKNDDDLEIVVNTTQGGMTKTFPKTGKIQDVINAVISFFQFAQNGSYELRKNSEPQVALKAERTLVSYHVVDGEVFIFTDLGVAV